MLFRGTFLMKNKFIPHTKCQMTLFMYYITISWRSVKGDSVLKIYPLNENADNRPKVRLVGKEERCL